MIDHLYALVNRPIAFIFAMAYLMTMQAIIDYLEVTGITQSALAKKAGMSATELSLYISGRREPRLSNLRKLSEATGMSVDRLINGVPKK